ncbi:MAG TPA: hypothetical protein VIF86_00320 [Methylobacter sp.]|jgi:hypothetical protein
MKIVFIVFLMVLPCSILLLNPLPLGEFSPVGGASRPVYKHQKSGCFQSIPTDNSFQESKCPVRLGSEMGRDAPPTGLTPATPDNLERSRKSIRMIALVI